MRGNTHKKMMFILTLSFILLSNFSKADARDVWVGTSPATRWECYIMTETIRHLGDSDINLATLKMVTKSSDVRLLEYRFWYDFRYNVVRFSNSQGFNGVANAYDTPIEWRMWQVMRNHNH